MAAKANPRFRTPTINEVELYLSSKKAEWPQTFIEYYAARFWNHYEASGWRLSSGNAVKNWQACFNANWQNLKFHEDIQMLERCRREEVAVKHYDKADVDERMEKEGLTVETMNEFLTYYRKKSDLIGLVALSRYYEWMKLNGYIKVTSEEVSGILECYMGDNLKCRGAAVQISLNKMITYQKQFGGS